MKYAFIILFAVLQFLPIGFAQDYTKWELPEGAFARLGKGSVTGNIVFSPDSTIIAIPSSIGIWLYNAQTYKELALLTAHVNTLAFSPDGTMLASISSWDDTIQLWDMSTILTLGKLKATLTGHTRKISSIAFSSDGKTFASASDDMTVVLWDPQTGEQKKILKGHTRSITSIAFAPNNSMLASASYDGTIRLWNIKTGQRIRILNEEPHIASSVTFSQDSSILAL